MKGLCKLQLCYLKVSIAWSSTHTTSLHVSKKNRILVPIFFATYMKFQLSSDYVPMGDQPEAIAQLVEGVKAGTPEQTQSQIGRASCRERV